MPAVTFLCCVGSWEHLTAMPDTHPMQVGQTPQPSGVDQLNDERDGQRGTDPAELGLPQRVAHQRHGNPGKHEQQHHERDSGTKHRHRKLVTHGELLLWKAAW